MDVRLKKALFHVRWATSYYRLLPNFLILGAQRSGTSSLYKYISQHPCVAPAFKKEVHFFDLNYHRGLAWYKANFVTRYRVQRLSCSTGYPIITGEASPYYLFHPLAPERAANTVPDAKLIVTLRNPVYRSYSHYHHEVRRFRETLSFAGALEQEGNRLRGEGEKLASGELFYSSRHQDYSYSERGIYIDQLKRWRRYYPSNQMLILKAEELFATPGKTLRRIEEFLELPVWNLYEFRRFNVGLYNQDGSRDILIKLREYFRPYNNELYDFIGSNFGWEEEILIDETR